MQAFFQQEMFYYFQMNNGTVIFHFDHFCTVIGMYIIFYSIILAIFMINCDLCVS